MRFIHVPIYILFTLFNNILYNITFTKESKKVGVLDVWKAIRYMYIEKDYIFIILLTLIKNKLI